jgi:hypothetical protein
MKKFFILSFVALSFITSCGKDDGEIAVNNQITIGDNTYDVTNGAFIDLGEAEGLSEGAFAIADANITASSSSFSVGTSSTIRVIFNLASLGSGGLKPGTYSEGDVLGADAGSVFFITQIRADGTTYSVDGGTIKLSGTSPNYTLIFDLNLDGGSSLTGGFSGTFVTN